MNVVPEMLYTLVLTPCTLPWPPRLLERLLMMARAAAVARARQLLSVIRSYTRREVPAVSLSPI